MKVFNHGRMLCLIGNTSTIVTTAVESEVFQQNKHTASNLKARSLEGLRHNTDADGKKSKA